MDFDSPLPLPETGTATSRAGLVSLGFIGASALLLLLLQLLQLLPLRLRFQAGARHCAECFHCTVFFLSLFCLFSISPMCLFGWTQCLLDPITVASLLGCSSGCSPDSAPSLGAPHVGSVDWDPPRFSPPCDVSVSSPLFSFSLQRIPLAFFLRLRTLPAPLPFFLCRALPAPSRPSLAFLAPLVLSILLDTLAIVSLILALLALSPCSFHLQRHPALWFKSLSGASQWTVAHGPDLAGCVVPDLQAACTEFGFLVRACAMWPLTGPSLSPSVLFTRTLVKKDGWNKNKEKMAQMERKLKE